MSSLRSKPMRKGTKSCLGCRRKTRCVSSPNESGKCVSCHSRGFPCTKQGRTALRDAASHARVTVAKLSSRVEELEAIIKSTSGTAQSQESVSAGVGIDLVTGIHRDFEASRSSIPRLYASSPASTDVINDIQPMSSLFDNAVWSRNRIGTELRTVPNEATRADTISLQKRSYTLQLLLKVLPAPKLLSDILEATCFWWNTWRAVAPWVLDTLPEKCSETLSGFVVFALSSNDPSFVGLCLLCIAASVQHLDSNHGHILRQLPSPQAELFHKYFSCVDALILNDPYYASSMVGLGVGVLAAKLLMNLGLIKKAWLLIHRNISYGQILGLQSQQRSQTESETVISRRERTWLYLCEMDLYTSLVIGLPYAANASTIHNDLHVRRGTTSWFQSRLLKLSAHIIDRNQAGHELSITLTQDLQKDAALAAYDMDRDFWDAPAELRLQRIDRSEYMERIASQVWYHHICAFIHMPLMIKSIEDPALQDRRTACLTASREALKVYHIMRSDPLAAFRLEKLIDYQTFICATLILLGQLGLGFLPHGSESSRYDRDRELIESTLEILRRASKTSNNFIAAQAVQGLETLATLAQSYNSQNGKCPPNPSLNIVVPFSGTITIFPGSSIKCSRGLSAQASANMQPVFTLSSGFSRTLQSQPSGSNHNMAVHGPEDNLGDNNVENQFPSIDFSWENMIESTTEDNWAWLADMFTT